MKKYIFFIVVCLSTFYICIKCSQAANFNVANPPIDKINFTPVIFENAGPTCVSEGVCHEGYF